MDNRPKSMPFFAGPYTGVGSTNQTETDAKDTRIMKLIANGPGPENGWMVGRHSFPFEPTFGLFSGAFAVSFTECNDLVY